MAIHLTDCLSLLLSEADVITRHVLPTLSFMSGYITVESSLTLFFGAQSCVRGLLVEYEDIL